MADDSSELDEIVQVGASWHTPVTSDATKTKSPITNPTTVMAPIADNNKTTADNQNDTTKTTSSSISGGSSEKNVANINRPISQIVCFDDSTTNGFTTAPATSDDDYLSDDDDDSRSNYSTNNNNSNSNSMISISNRHSKHGGKHTMVKGEEKRSHHNVLERKRRDLLKDSFSKLRDSVPTTQPRERVSRAEILKQAADFIQSTVQRNANARAELEELVRKNRELEEQKEPAQSISAIPSSSTSGPPTLGDSQKLLVVNELVVKQEN